jgi:hypothetical protein
VAADAPALLDQDPTASGARSRLGAELLELLLIGGGSLVFLPLLYLYRREVGLDSAETQVGFLAFYAATVVNNPHFAVSYLLFYRNLKARALGSEFALAQRVRYLCAGFLVPLVLACWLGAALVDHSAERMGLLIQLMFFLVGWHYVKQGFGVVTVLSLRRGFRFSTPERRAILLHCFASWLYGRTNPRDEGRPAVVEDVLYTSLGHPKGLDTLTRALFLLSALYLAFVLLRRFLGEGPKPPLVPLFGYFITLWLWTAFSRIDPLFSYVIPALHSLQYLYFVWLSRRNEARSAAGPPAFRSVARSLSLLALSSVALGWLSLRALPGLFDGYFVLWDAIDPLGTTPYLAGIAAFVNIHHYAMDAVIWRREVRETQYLFDR